MLDQSMTTLVGNIMGGIMWFFSGQGTILLTPITLHNLYSLSNLNKVPLWFWQPHDQRYIKIA